MWSSIQSVKTPASFDEALALGSKPSAALIAGGSYLVREKNTTIHALVDIHPLLDKNIKLDEHSLYIGAGVTLQQMIDSDLNQTFDGWMIRAIKWSCYSKNIRNQRTLGGEIAQNQANSELMVILRILNPVIHVFNGDNIKIPLHLWDGIGIITGIHFNLYFKYDLTLKRFSVLESAPAYLIICASILKGEFTISVGGNIDHIFVQTGSIDNIGRDQIDSLSQNIIKRFSADQHGSLDYKQYLIQHTLQEMLIP
ncbi:MAG: FAD binding domain-containing protein [Candidatus Marinimicrobia bacterium]|nr:FAD binding domain-containing protein [Candidatus Neomarinimicrobiota bacterium]